MMQKPASVAWMLERGWACGRVVAGEGAPRGHEAHVHMRPLITNSCACACRYPQLAKLCCSTGASPLVRWFQ